MSKIDRLSASFRDPSGFLYKQNGVFLRQINQCYKDDYELLFQSDLYKILVEKELLIPHLEQDKTPPEPEIAYKVIQPENIPFISYPFEWSFSQLKDAALATLAIQKLALSHGMNLKDASAYNIQFLRGKPILIDTLSFEKLNSKKPWIAYRQFCQHFLAPLCLTAYRDPCFIQVLRNYIDGIPIDLTSKLLPRRSSLNLTIYLHIHLHARSQIKYAQKGIESNKVFNLNSMFGLIDSLEMGIKKLHWHPTGIGWQNYYEEHNYSEQGLINKTEIISRWLSQINPKAVWDLGANIGYFSRLCSQRGIPTLSIDFDPAAVEINYQRVKKNHDQFLLPLVMDLTNPTPGIGWQNKERMSFEERGPTECTFALALIHHLAISNNLSLESIASYLSKLGKWLIIEFVPKDDSQVQRLLSRREDIFPTYTAEGFEAAFQKHFRIHQIENITGSVRLLYLMEKIIA